MQTIIKNPNWWRRRTALEKSLFLLSITFGIIVLILPAGLIYKYNIFKVTGGAKDAEALQGDLNKNKSFSATGMQDTSQSRSCKDVCLRPECITTAANAIEKMNMNVDPCDNFYEFACGNYMQKTRIPDDRSSTSIFSLISDELQEQLRDIVSEPRNESDPNHLQMPYLFYQACMNKTLIEELDATPVTEIAERLGGWPVIKGENWNAQGIWSWQEQTKLFRQYGYSMDLIIDFSVNVDYKNSTKRILDFDQSSLGLSREFLVKGFNETFVKAYYEYMVDIAVLFGANQNRAEEELLQSLNFEIALANISLPSEKRRNMTAMYNIFTLKELQQRYPYLNWVKYANDLLPEEVRVDENERVNVNSPQFFTDLEKLLNATDNRIIANYMMWRMHSPSVSFLSERFRKRQLQYSTALTGRKENEPRWKECVDISSGSLNVAVGSLYVRKHFKEKSKDSALKMVYNIRAAFRDIVNAVDWMDDATKQEAFKKLSNMSTYIGYPDEMLDDNKVAKYYEGLKMNASEFYKSYYGMVVFGTNYAFRKLREPVNKTEWLRHANPAVVNAYYSSIENSIQFPAGILQGQFFNAQRPKYMNYGAIGWVIGHEITHGFDDQGRQFDMDGNLQEWWQPDTKTKYLEKAKCIIDQYANYTDELTELNLNGINTQGENIADNGGLKESYRAYNDWTRRHGTEQRLPGLEQFKPKQLFWLSAAQIWCSKYRKASLKIRITTGAHSPGHFRVLGPFSNMKDFSMDYGCPEGTKMNREAKCEVW